MVTINHFVNTYTVQKKVWIFACSGQPRTQSRTTRVQSWLESSCLSCLTTFISISAETFRHDGHNQSLWQHTHWSNYFRCSPAPNSPTPNPALLTLQTHSNHYLYHVMHHSFQFQSTPFDTMVTINHFVNTYTVPKNFKCLTAPNSLTPNPALLTWESHLNHYAYHVSHPPFQFQTKLLDTKFAFVHCVNPGFFL